MEHDSETRPFTFASPLTAVLDTALVTVRLAGPEGETRMSVAGSGPLATSSRVPGSVAARAPDGTVTASCPAGTTGVLVQSGADGHMLGTALGATMHLPALAAGTPLTVLCSDGLRTITFTTGVP
jgi:hypothetical protein